MEVDLTVLLAHFCSVCVTLKRISNMRTLFILLAIVAPCFGQAGKAELFGTIQDPSGLPVSKAQVQAEEQATMARFGATTDERGAYHILGLPAGRYVLIVEQPGFRTIRQSGITLRIADQTALNVTLEIGQPAQSIEVTAAAPLLQTASGTVSFGVDENKVTTLPLDGRNFIPLVTLSPGVALPGGALPHRSFRRARPSEVGDRHRLHDQQGVGLDTNHDVVLTAHQLSHRDTQDPARLP